MANGREIKQTKKEKEQKGREREKKITHRHQGVVTIPVHVQQEGFSHPSFHHLFISNSCHLSRRSSRNGIPLRPTELDSILHLLRRRRRRLQTQASSLFCGGSCAAPATDELDRRSGIGTDDHGWMSSPLLLLMIRR